MCYVVIKITAVMPCWFCNGDEVFSVKTKLKFYPLVTCSEGSKDVNFKLQSNPVITTSVYATLRLYHQIFCGTN
jgi:hypothetical protein